MQRTSFGPEPWGVTLEQQCLPLCKHDLLGCWSSLQQAFVLAFAAVTEEELSQALVDGEEITAPPARRSVENGCPESSAAESTTETERELLNFSLEETK